MVSIAPPPKPSTPPPPLEKYADVFGDTPKARARIRRLRLLDWIVSKLITLGGLTIILAVFGIFFFVFLEAIPLFRDAKVEPRATVSLSGDIGRPLVVGEDEYREVAFALGERGVIQLVDLDGDKPARDVPLENLGDAKILCAARAPNAPVFAAGTSDGRVLAAGIAFAPVYSDGKRVDETVEVAWQVEITLREDGGPIELLAVAADAGGESITVAAAAPDFLRHGSRKIEGTKARLAEPATALMEGRTPTALALSEAGDTLFAGYGEGSVDRLLLERDAATKVVTIRPAPHAAITALGLALGSETLLVGDAEGNVSGWHRMLTAEAGEKTLSRTREFTPMSAAIAGFAPSQRNKSFLVFDANGDVRLDHVTTERTLASAGTIPGATAIAIAPKFDGGLVAAAGGALTHLDILANHGDVNFGVLFTPTLYEGYSEPIFKWQSTGGTDEYEPKFSLIPLIFGSLKGVLYAMLFSAPLAILAALYTSQFASHRVRGFVKPTVELMGALPSVVVGFVAGLWLAPKIDANLVETLNTVLAIPLLIGVAALVYLFLPSTLRKRVSRGNELTFVLPFLVAACAGAFVVGSPVEQALFGGGLRAWLTEQMGVEYDARNCFVVGMALGFAVIPIIFTVAEDAMSNVPRSLRAASEALGASRWQTASRLVLPAASPGIFAGLMLGFGRAVGETMIVVMATGNTPILDLSIFNGMRTISACIATEMPEAPEGGSLFRILFLTGAILFVFTFLINTLAEVVGERLRRKYARW